MRDALGDGVQEAPSLKAAMTTAGMITIRKLCYPAFVAAVLWLAFLPSALCQEGTGTFPSGDLSPLPPAPTLLDSSCVVSILNHSTNANNDGTWVMPTVPANFGPIRARATCVKNGMTTFGQSDLFTVGTNQNVTLPDIFIGAVTPIPQNLTVTTATTTLTQAGQAVQLTVIATYTDGATQNITSSISGVQYQVSNPAIATVSADGFVTAVSSGTVVIQALNEGTQGIISIHVVLAGASNGGIPNSWILANFCPNFSQGVPCPQLADQTFPSQDPDHDGLTNLQEFQNGTDPNNPDTDGDGLTDGQEVLLYHTNPLLFSTDGTGIPDGIEVQTGTLGAPFSVQLAAAMKSLEAEPNSFLLAVNSLTQQASQQLTVLGHLIDGKTTIDLTSTQKGTNYTSSDLTICDFGAPDGNVFAGNVGTCAITVSNSGFTAIASGTITGFSPTPLSFVAIPGFANGVAVNGNYAYVAAGSAGLQVVNVTDRTHPVIAASLALAGNADGVTLVGNLAFVAAGAAGLYCVDVSNPLAPVVRGQVGTSGTALAVTVQGNTAYVANSTNLFLANVSNPASISAISSLPLAGLIRGVSVDPKRNVAVVAADASGIYVVDVSNPAAPAKLSQLSTGDAHQVVISGNYVFVADYQDLTTSATYQNSLVSVDISNPAAPAISASITDETLGGNLNDLVLSSNLALAADVYFVNGIPITDISDPTNLHSRAILNFPQRDDNGMGIAVDNQYVYLAADHSAIEKFGTTSDSRLYIGQYQVLQDTKGLPPTASIVSPAPGATVVQGSTIPITVNASDDVAVAAVNLQVNGVSILTDTASPYIFYYQVPSNATSLTLGAQAVDFGANVGNAANVVVTVIPDPGTTVTGRVLDGSNNPLSGFIVETVGHSAFTATDGTFSIPSVPTVSVSVNGVTVNAHGVVGGSVRAGTSATVTAVIGGTTNVGDIVTVSRPLIVVDSSSGAISALDTSQNPPTVIATIGAFGASPAGASLTPDGGTSLSAYGQGIRTFNLTTNPPSFAGDVGFGASTASSVAITSDGRFGVTVWGQNTVASINLATKATASSVSIPFGNSVAITPDSTTVLVLDNSNQLLRIFNLSPLGALTSTGKTVADSFGAYSGAITMGPNGQFALFPNQSGNTISLISIDSQHNVTVGASVAVCCAPQGIAITPDGTKAYVTTTQPSAVAVFNLDSSGNATDTGVRIPIPNGIAQGFNGVPGIAIAVDGKAYIANTVNVNSQGTVTVVDITTNTVVGTVSVPIFPTGIGVPR
jgi:sugar lactone lactonase YvrE